MNDDASAAASLTTLINANETHIDNLATLTGVAKDEVDLGTFSGVTIADDQTIKEALQALETSVESKGSATSLTSLTTAVGDLNTPLRGRTERRRSGFVHWFYPYQQSDHQGSSPRSGRFSRGYLRRGHYRGRCW